VSKLGVLISEVFKNYATPLYQNCVFSRIQLFLLTSKSPTCD
jgi:hypothetical protein